MDVSRFQFEDCDFWEKYGDNKEKIFDEIKLYQNAVTKRKEIEISSILEQENLVTEGNVLKTRGPN